MNNLLQRHCVPCEGGTAPLSAAEAAKLLPAVPQWQLSVDAKSIEREFIFKDFKEALAFVNEGAQIAEQEGHHPDIYISWNKVRLILSTHAINGLSENDFILAAKIDAI